MVNYAQSPRSGRVTRCAVCDGKFGLVRHRSWRTQFCSKKCFDLFRARRQSDLYWIIGLQIDLSHPPESCVGGR